MPNSLPKKKKKNSLPIKFPLADFFSLPVKISVGRFFLMTNLLTIIYKFGKFHPNGPYFSLKKNFI